ncbi:MAG TPA: hypothetical protein PLD25_28190 [Chloroflexota bacterium]|nr:hypothetical protein [Chloroflexota bacterium]
MRAEYGRFHSLWLYPGICCPCQAPRSQCLQKQVIPLLCGGIGHSHEKPAICRFGKSSFFNLLRQVVKKRVIKGRKFPHCGQKRVLSMGLVEQLFSQLKIRDRFGK